MASELALHHTFVAALLYSFYLNQSTQQCDIPFRIKLCLPSLIEGDHIDEIALRTLLSPFQLFIRFNQFSEY